MTFEFWHWLALGFALLVLEMLLPTEFILLWVGAAAIVVGGVSWLAPALDWTLAFVLWGVLSVAAVLAWRKLKPLSFVSERPTLNRRGESYVGRVFTLDEPIVNGVGKLRVDDSHWRVSGPECAAGDTVRVVAADGATLRIEKLA
ncbi:MAG: NfeD family protein [Pseudomonadota bacterium]|nr:NfeD family protein [Pseudomonadota bacterium]